MTVPNKPYCNTTTDLQRAFTNIENYNHREVVKTWTIVSGQADTYSHRGTGYVNMVFDDTVPLTVQTSIANVQSNVGSFYYDSTNDILYVHQTGAGDPDTSTIEVTPYDIWANFKQQSVYDAMSELEAMLDPKFPIPLPMARHPYAISGETRHYEYDIVQVTAILACKNIIQGVNPGDMIIKTLMSMLINEDETGIIDEHRSGKRAFKFEMSGDEHRAVIEPKSVTSGSGRLIVYGEYTGGRRDTWLITITTGGAIDESTTPKFKVSFDNGTTDHMTDLQGAYGEQLIKDGVYLAFDDREGNFTQNDTWIIHVEPAGEMAGNASLRSARLIRA